MPRKRNPKAKKNFKKNYQKKVTQQVELKKRQDHQVTQYQRVRNVGTGVITPSPNYQDKLKFHQISGNYAILPINSFNRQCQKITRDGLVGQTLFSRSIYLKGKLDRVSFNGNEDNISFEVIHGFVKAPLAWSEYTVVTPSTGTLTDLNNYIIHQVRDLYEDNVDSLVFQDKKRNNLKVLSIQRFNRKEGQVPSNDAPILDFKCHWKTNRKVQYTKTAHLPISTASPGSEESVDSSLEETNTFLNLNSWLPFCVVRFPNRGTASTGSSGGTVAYNSIHYYNDE